jgi:hypothetical protein
MIAPSPGPALLDRVVPTTAMSAGLPIARTAPRHIVVAGKENDLGVGLEHVLEYRISFDLPVSRPGGYDVDFLTVS